MLKRRSDPSRRRNRAGGDVRNGVDDLRGTSQLAIQAIRQVTGVVEDMHRTILGGPAVLGSPLAAPARLATGAAYCYVRGVTGLVGGAIDLTLARLAPLLGPASPGPEREAFRAALNGIVGDFLAETCNPLAIEMRLRRAGQPLRLTRRGLRAQLPNPTRKLLILVHGSSLGDLQWNRRGHDHGAALQRDLGFTPVYVNYNSGLHVSTNGRRLDELLEDLAGAWPIPLTELVLLGHSMGGLVARSACDFGERGGRRWRRELTKLVTLGAPHHGAPLEQVGHWFDLLLPASRYSAPLARLGWLRSAGVTDLRFGYVLDEHWQGRDRFGASGDPRGALRLPAGVACYAIAATTSARGGGRLRGDGLVPVGSALGRHARAELTLSFPEAHQWIGYRMGHLDLLSRLQVYAKLRRWLLPPRAP